MILAGLVAAAIAAPGFDRVDLLSEDPGLYQTQELPRFGDAPRFVAFRTVTQLKVVWRTGFEGLHVGTSIQSQSVVFERPFFRLDPLYWTAGVQTRTLLPKGLIVGVAARPGPLRIGASLNLLSEATWARPSWKQWTVLPSVGVGIGRRAEVLVRPEPIL